MFDKPTIIQSMVTPDIPEYIVYNHVTRLVIANYQVFHFALFGSYGWGDGEWMRSWESRCNDDGANLVCDSVICNKAPDDDALSACRNLGASLV